jgi:hypothetical protein
MTQYLKYKTAGGFDVLLNPDDIQAIYPKAGWVFVVMKCNKEFTFDGTVEEFMERMSNDLKNDTTTEGTISEVVRLQAEIESLTAVLAQSVKIDFPNGNQLLQDVMLKLNYHRTWCAHRAIDSAKIEKGETK